MLKKYYTYITGDGVLDMTRMLITRIQTAIENEPWDQWLIEQEEWIDRYIIWPVVAVAGCLLLYVCTVVLMRAAR